LDIGRRLETYEDHRSHLFAEHGHAWDAFNRDTSAARGYTLAQFVQLSSDVRHVEGLLYSTKAQWLSGEEDRPAYYRGAASRYLATSCFPQNRSWSLGIFAMGHTHDRQLTIVRVRAGTEAERTQGEIRGAIDSTSRALESVKDDAIESVRDLLPF
jgi:hypothetical protein